jgi:arginyl-tRNA synthetase
MGHMNVFQNFTAHVRSAVEAIAAEGIFATPPDLSRIVVELPRDASRGDLATNAAMVLAKDAGLKPSELAQRLAAELRKRPEIITIEVVSPGFINFTLDANVWRGALREAIGARQFGKSDIGKAEPVNVEYVSANPTGPLHVGHGRGAVFGDALARLLAFAGYTVSREYYINDAGAQVDVLAHSAYLRYREALGEKIDAIPEGLYPGDYLKPVGATLAGVHGRSLAQMPLPAVLKAMEQASIPWDVFVERFEGAVKQYDDHEITSVKAGELLHISAGYFLTLRKRYKKEKIGGLRSRHRMAPSRLVPEPYWLPVVRQAAVESMLVMILKDLKRLNIEFDVFFSEKALSEKVLKFESVGRLPVFYCASQSYDLINGPPGGVKAYFTDLTIQEADGPYTISAFSEGSLDRRLAWPDYLGSTLKQLEDHGLIYQGRLPPPKGAPIEDWEDREQTLFHSIGFGDDIDRPLKKSDGSYTYFASDIAYHKSKVERGFRNLIDVWGADHGGYIKRMKAAVAAVSGGTAELDVKLIQLVKLLRDGQPVKMSKRAGDFVTLHEVVDEVGSDAVRFMMLYRKNDAVLDFDLVKVKEQSRDNPVFYVQYGHARGHSIFRNAREEIPDLPADDSARAAFLAGANFGRLDDPAEIALMRRIALYPRLIESAAGAHEPHRVAFYLYELASEFHALWTKGKDLPYLRFIIQNDPELTRARLALVQGVVTVLASGLGLLGVGAPVEMR